MKKAGTTVVVRQDQTRNIQGAEIEILNAGGGYPDTKSGKDINNDSIVFLLKYKDVKVLLTGDIEQEEGSDLVKDYCPRSRNTCEKLDVDIIKIPHHGSAGLSRAFVKRAAAEYVLISAGNTNNHCHPRTGALQTYKKCGAQHFYSTSAEGTNHLTVTIGPSKNQISVVDGARSAFSSWRKSDGKPCFSQECKTGRGRRYCDETWTRGE